MSTDGSPAETEAAAHSIPRPDPPLVRCVGVLLDSRSTPSNFELEQVIKKGDQGFQATPNDGFPQSVPDGEADEPSNSTPLTFELVSSDEVTDNEDGTDEEDEDCDSPSTRNRRHAESFMRYKEDYRKAAELREEAKEAWDRDDGSWFVRCANGEVTRDWCDTYLEERGYLGFP